MGSEGFESKSLRGSGRLLSQDLESLKREHAKRRELEAQKAVNIGDRLDNKYVVKSRLGGGGYGEVFLAVDETVPDRPVAIKVLRKPAEGDQRELVWEMQALAKFGHPNVVRFYHHFNDGARLYLVMEYCSGGSLRETLSKNGPFPEQQVFEWGLKLCETLAFVHAKGIVHHDIKPLNILFAADGTIKLGDFGIANTTAGTVVYMSPEMLRGEPVTGTDARVDIYALGITLFEMLTGRQPFGSLEPKAQLEKQLAHDFIPTKLPRWVQGVLFKATHPIPELRFQTAADFVSVRPTASSYRCVAS